MNTQSNSVVSSWGSQLICNEQNISGIRSQFVAPTTTRVESKLSWNCICIRTAANEEMLCSRRDFFV